MSPTAFRAVGCGCGSTLAPPPCANKIVHKFGLKLISVSREHLVVGCLVFLSTPAAKTSFGTDVGRSLSAPTPCPRPKTTEYISLSSRSKPSPPSSPSAGHRTNNGRVSLPAAGDLTDDGCPRKSEVSTHFASNASVAAVLAGEPGARGECGAGGAGGASDTGGAHRLAVSSGGDGLEKTREGQGGREVVTVMSTNPGMLVRPPMVADGKLKHDRARRDGVASDLEAVIAVRRSPTMNLQTHEGQGSCCVHVGVRSTKIRSLGLDKSSCPLRYEVTACVLPCWPPHAA